MSLQSNKGNQEEKKEYNQINRIQYQLSQLKEEVTLAELRANAAEKRVADLKQQAQSLLLHSNA